MHGTAPVGGPGPLSGAIMPVKRGLHEVVVEAGIDRNATWLHEVEVKAGASPEIDVELERRGPGGWKDDLEAEAVPMQGRSHSALLTLLPLSVTLLVPR